MQAAIQQLLADCVGRRTQAELGAQRSVGTLFEARCQGKIGAYTWMAGELERILKEQPNGAAVHHGGTEGTEQA